MNRYRAIPRVVLPSFRSGTAQAPAAGPLRHTPSKAARARHGHHGGQSPGACCRWLLSPRVITSTPQLSLSFLPSLPSPPPFLSPRPLPFSPSYFPSSPPLPASPYPPFPPGAWLSWNSVYNPKFAVILLLPPRQCWNSRPVLPCPT